MLGYWILLQVLGGLPSLAGMDRGGVAFFAHIGGFVAGLVLVKLLRDRRASGAETRDRVRGSGSGVSALAPNPIAYPALLRHDA